MAFLAEADGPKGFSFANNLALISGGVVSYASKSVPLNAALVIGFPEMGFADTLFKKVPFNKVKPPVSKAPLLSKFLRLKEVDMMLYLSDFVNMEKRSF